MFYFVDILTPFFFILALLFSLRYLEQNYSSDFKHFIPKVKKWYQKNLKLPQRAVTYVTILTTTF